MPLLSLLQPSGDPATLIANRWLAVHAVHEALTHRWQSLETYLFREHNWPRLSRRQRVAIPEAVELDAIDDRLDALHEERESLIVALPGAAATTMHGLALKLAVATAHIRPEYSAEGHDLLKSIQQDLKAMTGAAA